ncbi:MAG: AAA family ATPase [Candidatus Dormibacteria bacterium]
MYIIRGLPGSGKSTLAKWIMGLCNSWNVLGEKCLWTEADHRMHDADGNYLFDPDLLDFCHKECFKDAEGAALRKVPYIIVSNTFTKIWEMQPYLKLAVSYKYTYMVIKCNGTYPNTHNVPQAVIDKMKARWEDYPNEISPKAFMRYRSISDQKISAFMEATNLPKGLDLLQSPNPSPANLSRENEQEEELDQAIEREREFRDYERRIIEQERELYERGLTELQSLNRISGGQGQQVSPPLSNQQFEREQY